MSESRLASIDTAIERIRQGRFVIVVDDEDRENEGDLVIAADLCDTEAVNFMATHGRGLICIAMEQALLDRLKIPLMIDSRDNSSGFGTAFTVSVEAASGVTTGISAADRAQTIATLVNPQSTPADVAMPGHMFPLRAAANGVLDRRGQTEASVDLARLAGQTASGVICEVMSADGTMARLPELLEFGRQHDIPVVSVDALVKYRQTHESHALPTECSRMPDASLVSEIATSRMPTRHGEFRMSVYRDQQGLEHVALVYGTVAGTTPVVRLHSECLTGDAFGSLRCDCGAQLEASLARISTAGSGVLLYLRQEGRGIGLGNKIKAYALQDTGLDTVEANHQLGFPADSRNYSVAAAMLRSLLVGEVRLLTNNPTKTEALHAQGINIAERLPLVTPPQAHNAAYLRTKEARMGHLLSANDSDTTSEPAAKRQAKHAEKQPHSSSNDKHNQNDDEDNEPGDQCCCAG